MNGTVPRKQREVYTAKRSFLESTWEIPGNQQGNAQKSEGEVIRKHLGGGNLWKAGGKLGSHRGIS